MKSRIWPPGDFWTLLCVRLAKRENTDWCISGKCVSADNVPLSQKKGFSVIVLIMTPGEILPSFYFYVNVGSSANKELSYTPVYSCISQHTTRLVDLNFTDL